MASATVASTAVLQIGDGGTTGTLGATTIANNGTLVFNRSNSMGETATITGTGDTVATIGGSFTLNGSVTQASVDLLAGADLTVAAPLVTSSDINLQATGTLALNAAASSSGGNIVLQTAHFMNNVGASALFATGAGNTWQVWSTNADPFNTNTAIGDKRNGLAFDFKQYNATYGTSAVLGTGNGLFYSITPSLDVALVGTVTKPYDTNTTATLNSGNYSYVGAVDGDVGIFTPTSGATYATNNAGSSINVSINGTLTGAASSVSTGSKAVYGYAINPRTSVSAAIGTITKVGVVVTGNSSTVTYNGGTQSVAGFTVSGLVGGETASVLTGVTASGASAQNAGTYTNTVTGTDGNYTLTLVNGALTINKANATVTGNSATVTYNGAIQTVSGFTATGLVPTETASVLTGVSASGASAQNAGTYTNTVTGTDGNYALTLVNGALTINKAAATVTGNSSTVTYNGGTQSVAGFTVSGLVGGETASVLTGVTASGASAQNAGTYTNTVTGTDGNYTLTLVNGALTINKANATVTGNSSTVTYNGQTHSVSGFTVTGLVNGETAAVLTGVSASGSGKNAGSYANAVSGVDSNYNLTLVDGALTINKANATVTANSATLSYNGTLQTVTGFTVTGLVNGETASVLTGVSAYGAGISPGTYATKASGTAQNYALAFVDGVLLINQSTDFGAIKHDEIIKTTTVPVIQELVLPVICEASVSNYANLGRQSCAVPGQ